ncbi:MAG: M15 family metallopeptidase, partial [Spirochaetes bacterium]|nr:M15 family metallopeptidase [Spirochaetota bacterium]
AAEYRRHWHLYFNYPVELPCWESTAAQREAFTRLMEERRSNREPQAPAQPARRPQYFHEALFGISNRNQAWAQQVQIQFLGHPLTIHSRIAHKVSLIEEIIMDESKTNPAVRQWKNSLGTVAGWSWRNISSSGNRSLHSYGIAIDLLPRNLGGLATYWAWTSRYNSQWWNIPFSQRYHPPVEVIRAFESFGFFWGGKWLNHFDTMHFEYRPEVFILNNIPIRRY